MKYGVTGPRQLTRPQEDFIFAILKPLFTPSDELTSGAAHGVDSLAAHIALYEGVGKIRLTVPAHDHNTELVRVLQENPRVEVIRMPAGTTYMDRNDETLKYTDVLLAFPHSKNEERRSGTWATIRHARKKGCVIHFFPLDGTNDFWTERP